MIREILAVIPARGGSKSIPRKNLVPICGKPLIAWSIAQSLACSRITRTIVSTDDEEIAGVARQCGAGVPFHRPSELARDSSRDFEVFSHALQWLAENEGYRPELVVHLRPTGPVRRVEVISAAIDLIIATPEADALRSVSWPLQTPYKMWTVENQWLKPLISAPGIPESHSAPRQTLPEVFWQNGYVDVIRATTILGGRMAGDKVLPFVINEPIYEIDYAENLPAVEAALREMEAGHISHKDKRHPV